MVYEAGPTGHGLARRAVAEGIELAVCTPGKTERPPADRVKTDRRGTVRLARLLAAGELTLVTHPPGEREQLCDLEALDASLALPSESDYAATASDQRSGPECTATSIPWGPLHLRGFLRAGRPCGGDRGGRRESRPGVTHHERLWQLGLP